MNKTKIVLTWSRTIRSKDCWIQQRHSYRSRQTFESVDKKPKEPFLLMCWATSSSSVVAFPLPRGGQDTWNLCMDKVPIAPMVLKNRHWEKSHKTNWKNTKSGNSIINLAKGRLGENKYGKQKMQWADHQHSSHKCSWNSKWNSSRLKRQACISIIKY